MERRGKNEILKRLYYDVELPSGLGGLRRVFEAAKKEDPTLRLKDVKEFLSRQPTHTLHRVTNKKFPRRKILAPKPRVIISCDLTGVGKLAKFNKGYKYLAIFIDIFSRYLKVIPLKKKNADTLLPTIKLVMESNEFKGASRLFVDKGGEFYNKKVQSYCKDNNIKIYSVSSYEIKASIAERVIQTLKRKIFKYLTANNLQRYIDVLPKLVEAYNNAKHTTLGTSPRKVHDLKSNVSITKQFYRMYKKGVPTPKPFSNGLAVGEGVRLADKDRRKTFRRGYDIQNTEEIFTVDRVDNSQYPPIYHLKDLEGEKVEGIFYGPELVKTALPKIGGDFPITILKKRGRKYLVHWSGYPDSMNSWVKESDLRSLRV